MEKDQKISIVTGAGTGVGKSASLALADEGWTIVLAGRRSSNNRYFLILLHYLSPDSL